VTSAVPGLSIHDAAASDAARLEQIHRDASMVWESDRAFLDAHPGAIGSPAGAIDQGLVRVAAAGHEIVGFATVGPGGSGDEGAVELDDLFVDPAWMRRGIGARLVADAAVRARAAGSTALEVTANPHALTFYERAGFVATATVVTAGGPGVRMRLDLDRPGSALSRRAARRRPSTTSRTRTRRRRCRPGRRTRRRDRPGTAPGRSGPVWARRG